MEFRIIGAADQAILAELFTDIDETFFRPHPFTADEATRIATRVGVDIYAMLVDGQRAVAYGMLRGWDEGYTTPALGVAVRNDSRGKGFGRVMMSHLQAEARSRGAEQVRLRVAATNAIARRLYESMSYVYHGEDRGELVMILRLVDGADS